MFSIEGKLFQTLSKIGDLFILNFFWLLGCLPIVTILPSTAALYHCCIKCVRRDRSKIGKEFWKSYKSNLRVGIPGTVLFGVLVYVAIIYMNYASVLLNSGENGTRSIFYVLCMIVYLLLLSTTLATFSPCLSRFNLKFFKQLQLSFFLGLRHLLRSVVAAAVILLIFYISLGSYLLVLFFPSLVAYLCTFLYEPIFVKIMPRDEAAGVDNWYFEGEEKKKADEALTSRRAGIFKRMGKKSKDDQSRN